MTHEYVIALGGTIGHAARESDEASPTAIAWAADTVLAVGSDAAVRAISRGDSTFLDLRGCAVTPLPVDEGATVDQHTTLESGSPADLAFWEVSSGSEGVAGAAAARPIAVVREGRFTEGDPRRGPFPPAAAASGGAKSSG